MVAFSCNLCGAHNQVEHFATEPATCACGSNVRLRALIHLLSLELFGQSMPLPEFPRLKSIRGLGMSDKDCYSKTLAEKFDYTNTFYDREPRFDSSNPDPALWNQYDFILSADVLEHVGPPVRSVSAIDLQSSLLVEGYQGPGRHAQLRLVRLDDLDGGQPVAPLVLDQGAVRTVQPPREASERDTAALSSAAKSGAQTDLRARVGRLPPLPMDHASILPYNGQTSIASLVGLSSDHAATSARSEPMVGRVIGRGRGDGRASGRV